MASNTGKSAGKLPLLSIAANEDLEASVALGVDRLASLSTPKRQKAPKCPEYFMQHIPTKKKGGGGQQKTPPYFTVWMRLKPLQYGKVTVENKLHYITKMVHDRNSTIK